MVDTGGAGSDYELQRRGAVENGRFQRVNDGCNAEELCGLGHKNLGIHVVGAQNSMDGP